MHKRNAFTCASKHENEKQSMYNDYYPLILAALHCDLRAGSFYQESGLLNKANKEQKSY